MKRFIIPCDSGHACHVNNIVESKFSVSSSGFKSADLKYAAELGNKKSYCPVFFVSPKLKLSWDLEAKVFKAGFADVSNSNEKSSINPNFKTPSTLKKNDEEEQQPKWKKNKEDAKITACVCLHVNSSNSSSDENSMENESISFFQSFDEQLISIVANDKAKWGISKTVQLSVAQENFKGSMSITSIIDEETQEEKTVYSLRGDVPFTGTIAEDNVKYAIPVYKADSYCKESKQYLEKYTTYPIPKGTYVQMHMIPRLYRLGKNPVGTKWLIKQIVVYDTEFEDNCASLPLENEPETAQINILDETIQIPDNFVAAHQSVTTHDTADGTLVNELEQPNPKRQKTIQNN